MRTQNYHSGTQTSITRWGEAAQQNVDLRLSLRFVVPNLSPFLPWGYLSHRFQGGFSFPSKVIKPGIRLARD
jgi:hypothetical protein